MPATVTELVARQGEGGTTSDERRRRYMIQDALDEAEALHALDLESPPTLDGLPRDPLSVEEVEDNTGLWFASVTWKSASASSGSDSNMPPEGTETFSFQITAQSQKIMQSLSTTASYSYTGSETPADFGGLIGVNINGDTNTIDGLDLQVPSFSFSRHIIKTNVNSTYIRTVADLVGTVNAVAFQSFDPGEVLMVGARGTKRGALKWDLQFDFLRERNRSDIFVGNAGGIYYIGPITKLGWEYLWVFTVEVPYDYGGGAEIRKTAPSWAYVEHVYRMADYSPLLITNTLGAPPP